EVWPARGRGCRRSRARRRSERAFPWPLAPAGSRSSIDRATEGDESSKGAFSLSSRRVPAIDRSPGGGINDQARRTKLQGRREKLLSKSSRGALVGKRPKR